MKELLRWLGYKQGSGNVKRVGSLPRSCRPSWQSCDVDSSADARAPVRLRTGSQTRLQCGRAACRQGQKQVPRRQARLSAPECDLRLPHEPPPPQQACLLPALCLAPASQTAGTELTKTPSPDHEAPPTQKRLHPTRTTYPGKSARHGRGRRAPGPAHGGRTCWALLARTRVVTLPSVHARTHRQEGPSMLSLS